VTRPPAHVLTAFGANPGGATLLPGGEGRTWSSGDLVIKPAALAAETVWIAEVLSNLPADPRFRVGRPVRARNGDWLVDGWEAWHRLDGATDPSRWDEVLAAGQAFHEALAGIPRPLFLADRDNPWTYGERLAWAELPITGTEVMAELLAPLAAARRPIDLPSQPVHGDLLGNVMFAEGLPPAIIDWPLYFRPPLWASAVVVVDALTWHQGPADLLERDSPGWDQLLVRALMFRIGTNEGFRRGGGEVREEADSYRSTVELVLSRV
jgi:uncharacterized protein (TIGR02569 family)